MNVNEKHSPMHCTCPITTAVFMSDMYKHSIHTTVAYEHENRTETYAHTRVRTQSFAVQTHKTQFLRKLYKIL